eukprot:scaffold429_cov321-Prasinococcus_capsulatus_cf.AAC.8
MGDGPLPWPATVHPSSLPRRRYSTTRTLAGGLDEPPPLLDPLALLACAVAAAEACCAWATASAAAAAAKERRRTCSRCLCVSVPGLLRKAAISSVLNPGMRGMCQLRSAVHKGHSGPYTPPTSELASGGPACTTTAPARVWTVVLGRRGGRTKVQLQVLGLERGGVAVLGQDAAEGGDCFNKVVRELLQNLFNIRIELVVTVHLLDQALQGALLKYGRLMRLKHLRVRSRGILRRSLRSARSAPAGLAPGRSSAHVAPPGGSTRPFGGRAPTEGAVAGSTLRRRPCAAPGALSPSNRALPTDGTPHRPSTKAPQHDGVHRTPGGGRPKQGGARPESNARRDHAPAGGREVSGTPATAGPSPPGSAHRREEQQRQQDGVRQSQAASARRAHSCPVLSDAPVVRGPAAAGSRRAAAAAAGRWLHDCTPAVRGCTAAGDAAAAAAIPSPSASATSRGAVRHCTGAGGRGGAGCVVEAPGWPWAAG